MTLPLEKNPMNTHHNLLQYLIYPSTHRRYDNIENPTKCELENFKGKLAHTFMVSYLVVILCLSDMHMVRTYITKENAKINKFCSYREKKIKFGNSESFSFPISPCATSLEREFPRNRKEFLCLIIQCMLNQIILKSRVL